jgi:Ser/Thr protein kinase RdoA (MazF antagonist)
LKFFPNDSNRHLLKLLEEYKKHNIGDKWQKILIAKMRVVKGYDTNQDIFLKLPKKIVHGDLYIDNFLFNQKNSVFGLVDYTGAGLFFRCYEVIRAFIQTNKYLGNLSIDPLGLKEYLKGYCQFGQLDKDELSSMLDLYIFIQATDSSFLSLQAFNNNNQDSLNYGLYRFKSLRHLIQNKEQLIKTIYESH